MNLKEKWKRIENYPDYFVSNLGRVKSYRWGERECLLIPTKTPEGYMAVCLYNGCKRRNIKIHRLIAKAFIPNPKNKGYVNHRDGNKVNNRIKNLEWTTKSEDLKHAYKTGLRKYNLTNANKALKIWRKKTNTKIVKIENYSLDKMDEVKKMAIVLKDFIIKQNLYTPIMGKNYVNVEGWMFAGGLMGLFPRIVKVEDLGNGRWMAQTEIIDKKTGNIVSSGFAICSKTESKKASFDEYAILSMAQTRSISKAYRNLIGWVVKLAGYESVPAEEMKKEKVSDVKQEGKSEESKNSKIAELKTLIKETK